MSYVKSEPDENGARHYVCSDCGEKVRTGHRVNGSCVPVSVFAKGQRVRVVNLGDTTYYGEEYTVELQHGNQVLVENADGVTLTFDAWELEIIHDGRAESTGIHEPQEDTFRVDQRVTINANPQAPASIRKLDGMSGKVCTMVPHIEVVLDGTFGRHVVDASDLIPEVVQPSKRDEYAAKAEERLATATRVEENALHSERGWLREARERDAEVCRAEALVFATLAVAYGREQER